MGTQLQGPPFTLFTSDLVLQEGDSESAFDTDTRMPYFVWRRFVAACDSARVPVKWWNTAVSGTGMITSLGRVQAGLAKYNPTKFFAVYGSADIAIGTPIGTVNDVATPPTTVLGAFNQILSLTAGAGIPTYIATVMCMGEHWPVGGNANDANIDLLVAGMTIIAARYPLCTFRDLRATLYTLGEPIDNPTNLAQGPYTRPDAAALHYNPGGRAKADAIVSNDINVVTVTSNAGSALYSQTTDPAPGALIIDYDPATLALTDGANVTAFANGGILGTAADLVTTPATKPVWHTSDSTKINNSPIIQSAGAGWIRSAAFAAQPLPVMTAILFKPTNLTGSQAFFDGASGANQPSMATLATTGQLATAIGTATGGTVAAATWNLLIQYWGASRWQNYSVLNGLRLALQDFGAIPSETQVTLFATGASSLICVGMIARLKVWSSIAGALPNWQGVQGWFTTKYGVTPQ